jgi:nucleoside-diphosphate-sugar epimerase
VVAAEEEQARRVTWAGGLVLRLGHLYGPGSGFDPAGGGLTRRLRAGRLPLIGDGPSLFSFIHAHDVATAILAAATSRPGWPAWSSAAGAWPT